MFAVIEDQDAADLERWAGERSAFYNAHFTHPAGRSWTPQDFGAPDAIDKPENVKLRPMLEKLNKRMAEIKRQAKYEAEGDPRFDPSKIPAAFRRPLKKTRKGRHGKQ